MANCFGIGTCKLRRQTGTKSVIVCNAFSDAVSVRFGGDKVTVTSESKGGGAGIGIGGVAEIQGSGHKSREYEIQRIGQIGFTEIGPGKYMQFDTSTAEAYLTIRLGNRKVLCDNLEIVKNTNYIVDSKGELARAKKKPNHWIDENGTNHEPKEACTNATRGENGADFNKRSTVQDVTENKTSTDDKSVHIGNDDRLPPVGEHVIVASSKVPKAEKINTFNIGCPEDQNGSIISSCIVLPTGDIVVCDFENTNVKLFDKHYTYRSVFKLPGRPWDSCLSQDDSTEVLVTVPTTSTIYRIKVGDDMKVKGEIVVRNMCNGITCCLVGIAVILGEKDSYIQLLQYDGTPIKRLDTSIQVSYDSRVTSIMNGRQLVILESLPSRVISLDVDTGKTVFEYKDKDLRLIVSVTSDSQDNIYVVGKKSYNVHMISSTGEKLGVILTRTDGLNESRGLEYNRYDDTIFLQPDWLIQEMCVYKIFK